MDLTKQFFKYVSQNMSFILILTTFNQLVGKLIVSKVLSHDFKS